MHHTLSRLTAHVIQPLDCRDARRSHLLTHVSKPKDWHQLERDLHDRSMEVPALPQEGIRCEATTVSGAHEVTAEGLLQCGQRKDDPPRPQSTVMRGSLAPLGMPLATDVLSGARADAGVDLALMERIRPSVQTTGLLCVGAWKRRALAPRASMAGPHDVSLSPWP
jgi:transposase